MKLNEFLNGRRFWAMWLAAGAVVLALVTVCLVDDSYGQATSRPGAATKPADPNATTKPVLVTQEQFMKVMQASCVRCHRQQCASVDALKKVNWLVPGKPDNSPVYKVIGVNRNPKGTYHNLSPADKQIVHDFIQQMVN